jgi:hypothetical protein
MSLIDGCSDGRRRGGGGRGRREQAGIKELPLSGGHRTDFCSRGRKEARSNDDS